MRKSRYTEDQMVRILREMDETPVGLAAKLIPHARELSDFRMLAHRVPLEMTRRLQDRAVSEECQQAVDRVLRIGSINVAHWR